MDFQAILDAVKTTPTLKQQIIDAFITGEVVGELIEKKDPKVSPVIDRHVTRAIESFKEKGLQTILDSKKTEWTKEVEAEFAKKHKIQTDPALKALEDKIAELEKASTEAKREKLKSDLVAKKTSVLAQKKLDIKLADFIALDDPETAETRLEEFSTTIETIVNDRVKARLKEKSTIPGSPDVPTTTNNPFAKGPSFNLTKQAQILAENPDLAKELQSAAALQTKK